MVRRAAPVLLAMAFVAAPARADTLGLVTTWGSTGTSAGHFANLYDVAVSPDEHVYTVEDGGGAANRVQRFDSLGAYFAQFGSAGAGPGQFQDAFSLSVADDGVEFGGPGTANNQFTRLVDVATDSVGNVYGVDRDRDQVTEFTATGTLVRRWGLGTGTGPGQLRGPQDAAIDAAGNVWIADTPNRRIERYDSTGDFVASYDRVGSLTISPQAIAFGPSGDLYIADQQSARVVRARVGAQGGGAAPVAGKTGNASVVSGTVLVKLPGAGKFVPLTPATHDPLSQGPGQRQVRRHRQALRGRRARNDLDDQGHLHGDDHQRQGRLRRRARLRAPQDDHPPRWTNVRGAGAAPLDTLGRM